MRRCAGARLGVRPDRTSSRVLFLGRAASLALLCAALGAGAGAADQGAVHLPAGSEHGEPADQRLLGPRVLR